jgi:hypothetical protein
MISLSSCTGQDPLYCDADTPCAAGLICDEASRTCIEGAGKLPLGSACQSRERCLSGFCVDGVCCDSSCEGACQSCAAKEKPGTCAFATKGEDRRGDCALAPPPPSCAQGVLSFSACDGNGRCAPTVKDCGGYNCDAAGKACKTSCAPSSSDCSATARCVEGKCVEHLGLGQACATYDSVCESGHCVDGVCCRESACSTCQVCNTPGSPGTCSPAKDGTPCGKKKSFCDDSSSTSAIKAEQCQSQACKVVTVSSFDPYRCETTSSGGAACSSSCHSNGGCTTGLCDLFDALNTCPNAKNICYVDESKTCPTTGTGTLQDPYCKIQACLDNLTPYVAIANGTYPENLTAKANVQLISTGTTGSIFKEFKAQDQVAQVLLRPSKSDLPGISISQNYRAVIYGFDIQFNSSSTASKPLVEVQAAASAKLKTCSLSGINKTSSSCFALNTTGANMASAVLDDVSLSVCSLCIDAPKGNLTVQNSILAGCSNNGLKHEGGKLTVSNTGVLDNGTAGIVTYNADVMLDRILLSHNAGDGLMLNGNSTGFGSNLLITGNASIGLTISANSKAFTFTNLTVVDNGQQEMKCDAPATFYNSIVWDTANTDIFSGGCAFNSSAVKATSPVPGNGNINDDPMLVISTSTWGYSPTSNSPCIDRGRDQVSGFSPMPALDILGKPRFVKKKSLPNTIDMGAVEVQ